MSDSYKDKGIPIKHNGRIVGWVDGKRFTKIVSGSKHFLRKPPAIAFTPHTLSDAQKAGAEIVEVIDKETTIVYRAKIQTIREQGVSIERSGFEQQFYWPMEKWTVIDPRQRELPC
jgi:hypothetical protein